MDSLEKSDRRPSAAPPPAWRRIFVASGLLGLWLALLLAGVAAGGAVHLLLPAAGVAVFWRRRSGPHRNGG